MKQQVARFSPHQNAKVFAVLTAISSLVFIVPFAVILMFTSRGRGDFLAMIAMPVAYLVFGYLSVAVGCWLYNVMFPFIGGIEYEARSTDGR